MTSNIPSSKSEGLGALVNKVATVTQPLNSIATRLTLENFYLNFVEICRKRSIDGLRGDFVCILRYQIV